MANRIREDAIIDLISKKISESVEDNISDLKDTVLFLLHRTKHLQQENNELLEMLNLSNNNALITEAMLQKDILLINQDLSIVQNQILSYARLPWYKKLSKRKSMIEMAEVEYAVLHYMEPKIKESIDNITKLIEEYRVLYKAAQERYAENYGSDAGENDTGDTGENDTGGEE